MVLQGLHRGLVPGHRGGVRLRIELAFQVRGLCPQLVEARKSLRIQRALVHRRDDGTSRFRYVPAITEAARSRECGDLRKGLRQAVNLVYYQGMKYREAAEILDVPVGTVKSRLHSAILKLNQAWIESHPGERD